MRLAKVFFFGLADALRARLRVRRRSPFLDALRARLRVRRRSPFLDALRARLRFRRCTTWSVSAPLSARGRRERRRVRLDRGCAGSESLVARARREDRLRICRRTTCSESEPLRAFARARRVRGAAGLLARGFMRRFFTADTVRATVVSSR